MAAHPEQLESSMAWLRVTSEICTREQEPCEDMEGEYSGSGKDNMEAIRRESSHDSLALVGSCSVGGAEYKLLRVLRSSLLESLY